MASQLDNPPRPAMSPAASASVRQAAKVKGYVDQQLEKTRKQVKTIDLIAGILVLVAFTVGFLTLAALIDAWIWPFSAFGRWVCLTLLIGGCLAYTAFAIVPLFLKRINPDYAAKMIEEAKPSFRNSLMNYVSLRKHPEEIKPAVLDAVSRQAATDLASVPSDAAVDQSKLIRLGFVLIALTLFAVGYKILSPKDPLQTVARILAPAGKIAQPAVVKIEDVQPGDVEIFFGEQLNVTATLAGSHRPEDVRLLYSTLDGQLTDQSISMVSDGTPNHYRVELSMAGGGIQSSLRYRVVARDGASPDYEVIVRPDPSIAIESLVFNAPAYTKIPPRTLAGIGDIEAIEGTKVTVHALANLPIQRATIELLNEVNDPNRPLGDIPYESRYKAAAAPIKMQFDGNSATGRIPVTLDSSREKPFASHYRIRFVSTDGDRNQQPNVYPIRVIPDLAPEIEIRNPVQLNVVVPINGQLAIDVLASDLDFEIKSVSLNIDQQGKNLLAQKLELSSDDGNRRVTARYLLRPSELELEVGDQAVFFAAAADNRISHASEQPDPNISRTQDFSLTVTDWNRQADEEMKQATQDQANENPENADNENDQEKNQDQANQDQAGDGSKQADDSGDGNDGTKDGNEGSNEGTEERQEGDSGNSGSEGNPSAQNEPGGSEGQGGGSSGEKPTGDPGEKQAGDEPSDGQGSGENSETKNSDQESPTGNQDSQGSGNQDSQGSGNPEGSQNNQTPGDGNQSSEGESESGDSSAGNQAPGESGSQDGGQGNQQDASAGPSTENPSEGDMASDGSDGQKDDSLTDGSKEQMAKNAPDGDRMKKLQELLGDDDEGDPESNDSDPTNDQSGDEKQPGDPSDANDSPGDEATNPGEDSQQPNESPSGSGDQSQNPGDGDQSQNAGNEEQQPGDGEQSPDQQPGDSENQAGTKPENSSDPQENGNKGSGSEQKPGNQSAADGQDNPNKGDAQTDPRDDKNPTSEDSDNNDSPREQSSKPGMDDANGKQSQDPGGEETDKTGNESGGTDPGESNSAGNEAGKTEAGNNDSGKTENSDSEQADPSQGDSAQSNPSDSGTKPGSEGQQDQQSGKPENSQDENAQPGGKSGEGEQGKGDSSEGQPGESGKKSDGGKQSGKPAGGKPGGSQSQSSPSEGTNDSAAGGIGGDGSTTGELLEREKTNYEHAKKATDMVLKKLSEQRYDPDPELLEKMNWTQQDMEKFLRRWEEMKRAAEQGNPVAKKKYDKSLKSLGFRAPGGRRPAKELDETAEGLSEDSAVNRPSPERVRDYNSFLKDLNRRDSEK